MRKSEGTVRKVARDIVLAYAHHIRDKVREENINYTGIGLDGDFAVYEALFKTVLGSELLIPSSIGMRLPRTVISESLRVVQSEIKRKGYTDFLDNPVYAECVFEVCVFILKKVKEEEFEHIPESYVH